jgi:hypothetical protein
MNGLKELVLSYRKLGKLARDEHPSLLGPFQSYEENKYGP